MSNFSMQGFNTSVDPIQHSVSGSFTVVSGSTASFSLGNTLNGAFGLSLNGRNYVGYDIPNLNYLFNGTVLTVKATASYTLPDNVKVQNAQRTFKRRPPKF